MLALIAYGLFWAVVGGLFVEYVITPKPVVVQEVGSGLPDIDPECWEPGVDLYDCHARGKR